MKILHLSDTHSGHYSLQKLPAADIIIHSGDVSPAGTSEEVIDFMDWFGELQHILTAKGMIDIKLFLHLFSILSRTAKKNYYLCRHLIMQL
jgi:3',5'-cyclic AMP phosphodiesterase CpdA